MMGAIGATEDLGRSCVRSHHGTRVMHRCLALPDKMLSDVVVSARQDQEKVLVALHMKLVLHALAS